MGTMQKIIYNLKTGVYFLTFNVFWITQIITKYIFVENAKLYRKNQVSLHCSPASTLLSFSYINIVNMFVFIIDFQL